MSRVKIVNSYGDYWIFPKADIRKVNCNSGTICVQLCGEDKKYEINIYNYETARSIGTDLDPFNVDTNVLWTEQRDGSWKREENK